MITKPVVLHCAIDSANYSSDGINKGFIQNGYEVIAFNWQQYRFKHGSIESVREEILRLAKLHKPELIFLHIQNSSILDEPTLIELSKISFTINYTFDVRSKEDTEWMYKLAPFVGLTLFACKEDTDECISMGIENTSYIHSSCDIDIYKPLDLPSHIRSKYPEIVFIGNNYEPTNLKFELAQQRVEMVDMLRSSFGERFKEYGLNWKENKVINPQEEINIYNSCKIVIAQNNFNRYGYTSDRLFRAMSCGALCLTSHYNGIENDFTKGVHLDWWHTIDYLEELVKYYLEHIELRHQIADTGRVFVIQNHTWANRVYDIKTMIKLL